MWDLGYTKTMSQAVLLHSIAEQEFLLMQTVSSTYSVLQKHTEPSPAAFASIQ